MDVCALILSIIAILISLLEIHLNLKLNKTNLKSEYYSKIYDNFLFELIPKSRNNIKIEDGRFIGFEELQNNIISMLEKSEFFKYADECFYSNLKTRCMELEDLLLNTANKKNIKLSAPCEKVDIKLKEIYKLINDKREKG